MSTVRQHSCIGRELISQGIDEPPAPKCRCRQSISKEKAKKKVDEGEARFVVLSRSYEQVEVPCPLCHADPEFKNCPNCMGTGRVEIDNVREQLGDDIVLVSRAAKDKKERKYRPALAMKTPRVATIEEEHIYLAYCGTNDAKSKAAQERIEEYGWLIQIALQENGAEIRERQDRVLAPRPSETFLPGRPEPKNNAKLGIGRDFDYGRTI